MGAQPSPPAASGDASRAGDEIPRGAAGEGGAGTYRAVVRGSGTAIAEHVRPAHTHWTRLKGLLGTHALPAGHGLWIAPCRQVHMFGMRYAIDLLFLDATGRVIDVVEALSPNTLSPKVAAATSVLELPAGTIAQRRVPIGADIDFQGSVAVHDRLAALGAALCNLFVAALFAFFASAHISRMWATGEWATTLPITLQESVLVVLFLTRRRSTATSDRAFDWVIGAVGTFLPLLLRTTDQTGRAYAIGAVLQIAALGWVVVGALSLGRSIGIVASNRGVKRGGLYRVVRHPMYTGYIASYAGYVAAYPNWRNALIVAVTSAALGLRARSEERLLTTDPAYAEYRRRVRWRFLPYLY